MIKNKDKKSIFKCDWQGSCHRIPFAEVFPFKLNKNGDIVMSKTKYGDYPKFKGGWHYLCLWHFLVAKVRGDKFAWVRVTIRDIIRRGEYED